MEPLSEPRLLRVEDLYALADDGQRYELEEGHLLSEPLPSPLHGRVTATLVGLLGRHARSRRLGVVLTADAGFVLARNPDTVRGPDVAFVSRARYAGVDESVPFSGAPDLAVEVLSPGNTRTGIRVKVADYLAAGARLVWVVDPATESVTVYCDLLSPITVSAEQEIDGADVLPGFRLRVAEIFER